MIAACPSCSARYRIEPERLRADGVRLRCSRCESVFRVRPPVAQVEPVAESITEQIAANPPVAPVVSQPSAGSEDVGPKPTGGSLHADDQGSDYSDADRSRMVLIADPEVESGKRTAQAVASWGLTPLLVHDGVEAMMSIQRMLPPVVVMDAALPKMFGFQICEVLKRNESLQHIHVLLVGAIHNRERYRRPPMELYGADDYLERHELVNQLRGVLVGIGMPLGERSADAPAPIPTVSDPQPQPLQQPEVVAASQPAAEPEPFAEPKSDLAMQPPADRISAPVHPPVVAQSPPRVAEPSPVPVASVPVAAPSPSVADDAPAETAQDPRIADAERLARIVVSDIILYNQEKFDTGVRDGNVLEMMASDLAEGRSLFDGRVDSAIRAERDFLAERLVEVARERGMA